MNTILLKGNDIHINVSVYMYLDRDYPAKNMYIAYCPSLNIIGYGYGKEAARKDFMYMLNEYVTEQLQNKTLEEDLKVFGWKKTNNVFDEPRVTDMAANNELLSDVLNSPVYSKVTIDTTCPVLA